MECKKVSRIGSSVIRLLDFFAAAQVVMTVDSGSLKWGEGGG